MFKIGNGEDYLKGFVDGYEYLISNTKEQICAFIMKFPGAYETTIVNMLDGFEISTFGMYINKCIDQSFLPELLEVLVPQQMGNAEPIEFMPYQYPDSTKYVKIELEVALPGDFSEDEVDSAIANAIFALKGEVLDSKEFRVLQKEELRQY